MQYRRSVVSQIGCLFLVSILLASLMGGSPARALDPASVNFDLSAFELKYFGRSFDDQSADDRLDRIERMLYGSQQSGSIDQRLSKLLVDLPDLLQNSGSTGGSPSAGGSGQMPYDGAPQPVPYGTSQSGAPQPVPYGAPPVAAPYSSSPAGGEQAAYRPDSNLQGQASQTETADQKDSRTDSHQTVSALERQILGETFETLPLKDRLAKMEQKVFGAAYDAYSTGKRIDILKEYVAQKCGKSDDYLSTPDPAVTCEPGQKALSEQVGALEKKVFDKRYGHDTLSSRIERLESRVFPGQPPQTFSSTIDRVRRLQAAVQPVQAASSSQAPEQNHHEFLQKLGKFIGTAGMVAGQALGSAAMAGSYMGWGGYGYGYGNGFGNYGFPGYGYGYGYGGLPYPHYPYLYQGYGYPNYATTGRVMGVW
jgi:hypothetical protein